MARVFLHQPHLMLPKELVFACEKGSGKRFPEDSLAPGWKRCLQDAGCAEHGYGEPLGTGGGMMLPCFGGWLGGFPGVQELV